MRKSTTRLVIGALLAASLVLAGCSSSGSGSKDSSGNSGDLVANSTLTKVLKRGTLRVAVLPDFPPSSSQKPDGTFEGYEPDIAKDLAKAMGVKLEMVSTNGDTRLSLMKSGKVDVNISSYTATNARAKSVSFTIPYSAHGASVLFRKDNPITSYAELNGKKVSVARGSTNDTIVTNDFPKADVVRFDTIADAIAAVKAGKVDACVEAYITVKKAADKDSNLEQLNAPPLDPQVVSMGILQGDPVWLNYLNNYIRNLIASGQDQKFYGKWFDGAKLPSVTFGEPPNTAGQ